MDTRRARLIVGSLVLTFVIVRVILHASPNADFDVAGYNIHHLFTGILLLTIGGIPLTLFPGRSLLLDLSALLFGTGLSLVLDEWVYLIATDGTNTSYLLPVSLHGGIIMIALAAIYVGMLYMVWIRRR
jgi:hypothetical protein